MPTPDEQAERDLENLEDDELDQQIETAFDDEESSSEADAQESDDEEAILPDEEEAEADDESEADESEASEQESEESEETATTQESEGTTGDEEDEPDERYTNLLGLYQRQSNELGELRKKVQELTTQQPETEQTDLNQQQEDAELSAEELQEMMVDDPVRYNKYVVNQALKEMQRQDAEREQQKQRDEIVSAAQNSLAEFYSKPEHKDMSEADANSFTDFVREHYNWKKPLTTERLEQFYNWFSHDKIVDTAKTNGRREAVKTLNDSAPKVKTLSTGKNTKARPPKKAPAFSDRSEAEEYAQTVSDDDLDALIDQTLE